MNLLQLAPIEKRNGFRDFLLKYIFRSIPTQSETAKEFSYELRSCFEIIENIC